jgi:uncharacterized DUF497 family protein
VGFEWDENKRAENIDKHNLDFVDAWQIFNAPMLVNIDNRKDYGEIRYFGIGFLKNFAVAVVFTEPDEETIRIISLRRALKYEREQFEEYIANQLGET